MQNSLKKKFIGMLLTVMAFSSAALAQAAERLAVATPTAKVRSGPGNQFDVLWEVRKHSPVIVLKKQGSWCQFQDHEGDTGWLPLASLAKMDTVVSIKKECQVRAGPGTQFNKITVIGPGIAFKVLERKADWVFVEHADGDRGWLHKSLVW